MKLTCSLCRLVLGTLLFSCTTTVSVAQERDTVQTKSGLISGIFNPKTYVSSFKGIPYARAPLAALRWKAPQPALAWEGVKDCTAFGASPYQNKPGPFSMWSSEFIIPEQPISEDCLYLNVWKGQVSKRLKPVVVWIYGGGFGSGGANAPIYDGEAMAGKGVVFVSFNYRVGIFGFMAHPELSVESGHQASGNYGLMDQIAALKWVKANIETFGGDPDQVTIAGQSAGSMSVTCLMASPAAKGLFNKAIAESGALVMSHTGIAELRAAEKQGQEIARTLQARSIAELRNLPAAALQKVSAGFRPVVDGYIMPEAVGDCFAAGRQHKVYLLTGWNGDEVYVADSLKAEDFKAKLKRQYGDKAVVILNYLQVTTDEDAARAQQFMATAERYGMQNFTLANLHSAIPRMPVYVYRFKRKVPGQGEYAKFGAFHTAEVPYVFHNLSQSERSWQAADLMLEKEMSDCWVNFILTGNPNQSYGNQWPPYQRNNPQVRIFDQQISTAALAEREVLQVIVAAARAKVP